MKLHTLALTDSQFSTLFHAAYMEGHDQLRKGHCYSALDAFRCALTMATQINDAGRIEQCTAIIRTVDQRITQQEAA